MVHLLLLLLLAKAPGTQGKKFPFTYPPFLSEQQTSTSGIKFQVLQTANRTEIASDNQEFALALAVTDSHWFLSIVHQKVRPQGTPAVAVVWHSNQVVDYDHPLDRLDVLEYLPVTYTYMELRDSGELLLGIDNYHQTWTSFRFPTDTLVVQQTLSGCSRLGCYTLTRSNGMFMFEVVAVKNPEGRYTLKLNSLQYLPYMLWDGGISDVGLIMNSTRFLRLEKNGDLVSYRFDAAKWDFVPGDFSLIGHLPPCSLPLVCTANGYCDTQRRSGDNRCRCFAADGSMDAEYSASCTEVPPHQVPQCKNDTTNDTLDFHFVTVTNATHFSTQYVQPDVRKTDVNKCRDRCAGDCNCAAFLYNISGGDCYYVNDGMIAGGIRYTPGVDAHLKFLPVRNVAKNMARPMARNMVLVGALAGVAAVFILALLITLQRNRINKRRHKLEEESQNEDSSEVQQILSCARRLPQRFTYDCLASATQGFSHKLGAGGFGSVYEGNIMEGGERRRLAVKKLERDGGQGLKEFIAEVASMGSVSHVNILKLCGFCVEGSNRLLVYEFMPNGSLDHWLFNHHQQHLTWTQRVEVALGVARGLAYLHEQCREPILHLDIKPQNILLDERMVAKVADFGMAKLLVDRNASGVVTCVRGTPGYLAPEWLINCTATKKCDVYSYGMVLLELLGGRRNLDLRKIDNAVNSSESSSTDEQKQQQLLWYFPAWAVDAVLQGRVMQVLDERVRSEACEKMATSMVRLALWCIQDSANLRPAMFEVVQMIEGHKEVQEPPMSFRFSM